MDSDDEEVPQLVEVEPAAAIPAVGYKIDGEDIPVSYSQDSAFFFFFFAYIYYID
jgi:hypothetical protein